MSNSFLNWTSRVAIAGRIAKHRRPHDTGELTTPGDYHLPREVAVAGLHHLKGTAADIVDWSRHGSGRSSAGKFFISGGNAT